MKHRVPEETEFHNKLGQTYDTQLDQYCILNDWNALKNSCSSFVKSGNTAEDSQVFVTLFLSFVCCEFGFFIVCCTVKCQIWMLQAK